MIIEVFYKGDEPIILNGIEFKNNKSTIVNEVQLQNLRKNPFFKDRERTIFKLIGKEEKKQEIKTEIKQEEAKEEKKNTKKK